MVSSKTTSEVSSTSKSTKRIFYIGLDIDTLYLLHSEQTFSLVGTSYIDNFEIFTFNPFNYVFKLLYACRSRKGRTIFEPIYLRMWKMVKPLSSGVFKKYAKYLIFLAENKISIFDTDVAHLKDKKIDLIVVNVWGILPIEIISLPKYGSINIHPSKLPAYRGSTPTLWALRNKENESAVTYIILGSSIDSGDILNQHEFNITTQDNWLSIEIKVAKIIESTLLVDIQKYLSDSLHPTPQNERDASYTPKYNAYRQINPLIESSSEVINKVNLYPYLDPGTYCYITLSDTHFFLKRVKTTEKEILRSDYQIKNLSLYLKLTDGIVYSRLFCDISPLQSLKLLTIPRKDREISGTMHI